jgi:hypothetical protein
MASAGSATGCVSVAVVVRQRSLLMRSTNCALQFWLPSLTCRPSEDPAEFFQRRGYMLSAEPRMQREAEL